MIGALLSLYAPRFPDALVYMLQNTEYRAWPYLAWFWRTQDFSKVQYRRQLVLTKAARLLLVVLRYGMALEIIFGLSMVYVAIHSQVPGLWEFGVALIVAYPVVWAHLIVVPLVLGREFIIKPRNRVRILRSEQVFQMHKAEKIAIVGSYGKTSMKELLLTVLSEGLRVAATPANKNVAISHAIFAKTLAGDEDVLLIEYGEGAPGDVARFARITHPNRAIITGVAAAHLDRYGSTTDAGKDIFTVAAFVNNPNRVYVNGESAQAVRHDTRANYQHYTRQGVLGWHVGDVDASISGLDFTMVKGKRRLQLHSGLLGRHNLGPLALAVALAAELGMNDKAIQAGVAKTAPFEHRMQPYELNGAWVIDDTYNGNIEGIRAGTELLNELPAKRKVYVTPGLVDQGKESQAIHEEMGRLIARSGANVVVLMRHSVTKFIEAGLKSSKFKGEVIIEDNPLNFYTNLSKFVASGDLVLLQNDWPDNYR